MGDKAMRKTVKFSKFFLPAAVISSAVIISGIVGFFVRGINFGLDFKPGLIEEVRVAPPVAEMVYNGSARITVELSAGQMDLVISGTGAKNETRTYNFAQYQDVSSLASAVNVYGDVVMTVRDGNFPTTKLFLNSAVSNQLTDSVLYIYPAGTSDITTDDIRLALASCAGVTVKQLGTGADAGYQIRMGVSADETQDSMQSLVNNALYEYFGREKVAVIKTDFIGSSFSKSIAGKSIIMLLCTVLLIWGYAALRFHWDFALGSVIALVHDVLIMMTFIVWTQMEFSTTVLAAVLTIIGYSINATVVILDRIRYNLTYMKGVRNFNEILDQSLSDTFTRSVITTATTLIAVVSLFLFTTGSIKDFSLALIVGLISGFYSSLFIAMGFISACRRNWRPEFGVHHSLKSGAVLKTQSSED